MDRNKKGQFEKGFKHSEEWKKHLSEIRLGEKHPLFGKKHSAESLEKMRVVKIGKVSSKETKKRISRAMKDKRVGANSHKWKGDFAGYAAMHYWIKRIKGKPKKCEKCGSTEKKKYEWANVDHKYRRKIEDYFRACTSCHRKFDIVNNNYKKQINES